MLNCRIRRRRRPSALPHDKQFQKRGERGRGHDRGRRGRLRNKRNRPVRHRDPARDPALVESIQKVSTTTYVKPCRGVLSDFCFWAVVINVAAQPKTLPPPVFQFVCHGGARRGAAGAWICIYLSSKRWGWKYLLFGVVSRHGADEASDIVGPATPRTRDDMWREKERNQNTDVCDTRDGAFGILCDASQISC